MRLNYVGKIGCHDCGTGYSVEGPLCEYENDGDPSGNAVILCDECAEKRDEDTFLFSGDHDEDRSLTEDDMELALIIKMNDEKGKK